MQNWHVAISTQGRDHLAADELHSRGFGVHVPMRFERKVVSAKRTVTCDLLLSPYLFVKFDTTSKDEHALVLKQRGVETVLLDMKREPGVIESAIILDHRNREYAERNSAAAPRAKKTVGTFELLKAYVIKRHPLFEGRVGKLVAINRGVASLDWEGGLIKIGEDDIAPYGWKPEA